MNYKKEDFKIVISIQDEMKKITKGLVDNFRSGNYLAVKDFTRGVINKQCLTELVIKINKVQKDFITGKRKKEDDYSGIYLFATKNENKFIYQYVGISQQVINRIKQHTCNSSKGCASWAFLMAKVEYNTSKNLLKEITKNNFKSEEDTKKAIVKQQEILSKDYFVTYYPVDNNFLMHMVEPYVACDLKCKWNSFETH